MVTYCYAGHPQKEHETRHGSMSQTRWTVDGPDDTAVLEVEGRRFSTNDEGAPMLCNLLCQALGRHVHIDKCRSADEAVCTGNDETQHIHKRLFPDPDCPKDYVTHNLFWKRSGKCTYLTKIIVRVMLFRFQGSLFERGTSYVCKMVSFLACYVAAHTYFLIVMLCAVVSYFVVAETVS